jgi:hypothetical protein
MTATVRTTLRETRLLVCDATGDRLIARLPPLQASHRWALKTLLESLALFSGERLRVVLCVDESSSWERLGLCDALAFGEQSLHLDVELVPHETPRAKRLTGLGSFAFERSQCRKAGT